MPMTTICSCVTATSCRTLLCFVLLAAAASCQQQQEGAATFRLGVLLLKETVFTDVRRFYQKNILNDTVASTVGGSGSSAYVLEADLLVDVKASPRSLHELACQRLVTGNVSAVVVFSDDAAVYKYITTFMASLGVPIIGWNPKAATNGVADGVLLLSPTLQHQAAAVISIMKHYKWQKLAVVTSDVPESHYLVTALKTIVAKDENEDMEIVGSHLVRVNDAAGTVRSLQALKASEARIILLHVVSELEAASIMSRAQSTGLTDPEYVWIGTTSVVESNKVGTANKNLPMGMLGLRTLSPPDSLTSVKMTVPKAAIMLSAVKLWMEGVSRYYKAEAHRKRPLTPALSCWTNQSFWEDGIKLYRSMAESVLPRGLNVPIKNSKEIPTVTLLPTSFNKGGTNNNVTLEIMNLGRRNAWRKIGYWNSPDTIELDDITWPGNAAKPPDGKPEKIFLKITTHNEVPYVNYLPPDPVTGQCSSIGAVRVRMTNISEKDCPECVGNASYFSCATGFCIDLLQRLKADINFDFEMFHVRDDKWGIADQNNEWNGIVRDLMDGAADLSMTSLKVVPDRAAVIDFSVPFLETGITILVAIRQGAVSPTAFLEPYDYPTWLVSLFVCVNLAGVVVFLMEYYSPLALNKGDNDEGHKFSLFRSLWLIWAILFSAAVKMDSTKGLASRFMTAVWALFSLVFLASYTANLAAFMITKEDFFNLEGIQDMRLKHPHTVKPQFRFATVPDGSTAINLKKYYPDMYSYMNPFNKNSIAEGISALRANEIHAFIYDATVLDYYATHDETCKLKTVGNWYAMTGYAIGFPKNSKYRDMFNIQLLKYINEGYLDRLRNFWLSGACKKTTHERENGSSRALEVINFTSAYILLAAGVVLATALLTCEHVYFRFCRRRLRQVDKWGCCQLISLSMGKSLTFEASVMEVIDASRHHQCKDELCNNQKWQVRHELDMALVRIDKLRQTIQLYASADLRARDFGLEPTTRVQKTRRFRSSKGTEERDPNTTAVTRAAASIYRRRRLTNDNIYKNCRPCRGGISRPCRRIAGHGDAVRSIKEVHRHSSPAHSDRRHRIATIHFKQRAPVDGHRAAEEDDSPMHSRRRRPTTILKSADDDMTAFS